MIGYDVNKYLQEAEGIANRTHVYFRNAITGDSGTGLGNGDDHTSLLAGNNSWLDGFMSYPSEIEDASFIDDGKIAFALPNRSGDIANAVSEIDQNGTVTALTDAQIAEQVTEGGGLTWIEALVVAHGDDKSVAASLEKVSTGTYNVQNYDTVSSADDSAYRGSKVYDGTMVKTPTLKVGGTTVNAWTADSTSTTADAGTKTFSYNEDALSGYATATYNGGTYLVRGGTIYSPDSIIVNGEERTFALGKDFVYEITPAPVEVVVANIPGTFYDGDPMPELTVQSVTPNVPGQIAWDDSSLVYGKNEYDWTWTPEDNNNYQPDTGTVMLEVLQATINEIVVSGDFETQYTAYDAFNPEGMVVTAYYDGDSEHERGVVLESSDYTVSVENGDINRLLVINTTVTVSLKEDTGVSTKISIIVSKLAVGIPKAIQGLVYNGGEQNGIDQKWIEQYAEFVKVEDNSQRDAGDYTATAALTYTDNTRWDTDTEDDTTPKEIPWTIAPMTLDGTVLAPGNLKYDGKEKEAAFESTVGTLCGSDQVTIEYGGVADRTNVTGEAVTATAKLPNDNYVWATDAPSASFVVVPMPVEIGLADVSDKTYDGNVVDPKSLFIAPNGVNDEGALQLAFVITVDGENRDEILNAGSYTVTAVLADGQTNYTAQSAQARYEIAKVVLTGTLTFDDTATYDGTAKTATFNLTSDNLVGQDKVGEVTYNEVDRINVTGQAIVASVALPSSGNYQWQDGIEPTASLTIVKATPVVNPTADVQGTLYTSDDLYKIALNLAADDTPGMVSWDKGQRLTADEQEYKWTFVPTDEVNYNGTTGVIRLTAVQAQLDSVTVDVKPNTAYTAFDAFDPTGMVVTAHYQNDATRVVAVSECELTVNAGEVDRLVVASTTVTVSYSDGDVTVSTTVMIKVSKLTVDVPTAVAGLVYNGAQQTGVEKTEHYTLTGNTAQDAGDYTATATLSDKDNTVWAGRDSAADVTIDWTIAQMTLDGTVLAEGSLEYDGTQKSAQFVSSQGELFGGDEVGMQYSGDRVNVTGGGFTATAQLPSSGNYKWAADAPSESFAVTPKSVVIDVTADLSKTYDGLTVEPNTLFIAPQGVDGGALALTATVDGGKTILNAGSYTVTAVLADGQTNYTAEQAVAEYIINKADPTVNPTADVQGTLYTSDDLYKIELNLGAQDTPGTVKWDEGQRLIAGEQGYNWTFVPTDSVNYNGATGVIRLTAVQAALTGIRVTLSDVTEYTAYDAFDRDGIVVEAVYGDVVRAVEDYELSFSSGAEGRLVAGEITVTVSYGDGGASFEENFVIVVAKLVVPTVFDATGETITLPIAESEYYNIYGNTAIEPGRYVATVELKDPANTMWEDGSTDVVSIAWTIREPVTSVEVIADILATEKVTWQNAEEFLDLEARYNALDKSEQTADATAKLEVLRAQYDALRNAAFGDIEAAHEVTAKSLGRALAAAAAGLSAAAIALAIAKRRSI